ncbi:hypothetical protein BJI69_14195 [Luteibacter rhizovicinus DSM 16549]|uniref:Uncharacterized protein n=1 Tax=Luteibacter rhizovicinus DSM 16549 TaxID=1440763 RepID=A0A0G9HFG5_9GAMM|nr:hypothetical protein [Luteibacter rhizovicinus]APG04928.1 hypothetical protein BJI69_14195 [Luteibacter rhizovicinus DSM 16549]KLD68468.1 hypothetical protein Y883_01965 [Luteibacter rhizovicinus DSM 16549]KLD76766.1 hypothetical protein Y886_19630 [Xanthomonas hyacinthi DSM 19077]
MNARPFLLGLIVLACVTTIGCASTFFVRKTQRDLDVDQCTYGAVVPHNIRRRDRSDYIKHTTVPACLRAKGYSDGNSVGGAQ